MLIKNNRHKKLWKEITFFYTHNYIFSLPNLSKRFFCVEIIEFILKVFTFFSTREKIYSLYILANILFRIKCVSCKKKLLWTIENSFAF